MPRGMRTNSPWRKEVSARRRLEFGAFLIFFFAVDHEVYKKAIKNDYHQRTHGKSKEEKERSMAEIREWVDARPFDVSEMASLKSVNARMLSHKSQLTTLVRINSNFFK